MEDREWRRKDERVEGKDRRMSNGGDREKKMKHASRRWKVENGEERRREWKGRKAV